MTAKTCGYRRKRDVPADGGKVKVCSRCDLWFSARPRERACDDCLTPSERARRAILNPATHTEVPTRRNGVQKAQVRGAQNGARSTVLGLTFKPGVPLYLQLAIEAAAVQRWSWKGWKK